MELILSWTGSEFNPVNQKGNDGIYLEYIEDKNEWLFSFSENVPLLSQKTALRRAREIAKAGAIDPKSGKRVGMNAGFREAKDHYEGIPDKLKKPEREYNK
jgi:hypothetical protein